MAIELINLQTRIYAIDSTALRSLKYDSKAKYDKGTRLEKYSGYKLHCLTFITGTIVPLSFYLTTTNVYDN